MIVTFYSFKGGVGRSMAVANVGDILARRGFRVLLIDFDLEAPGLEQYFQINQSAARRHEGLLDLLLAYKRSMSVSGSGADHFEDVSRFILPVYERLPGGGRLELMPAGQREGRERLDRYAANLRTFDWQDFYSRWEGELFFEWLRGALVPERHDLVIVDSRTGVTEMGGICTYQLADAIFMLSAANHQNRQGTLNVAADFQSPQVQAVRRGRPLDILAVPARVEQRDPALAGPFLEQFAEVFAPYLPGRVRDAGLGFDDLLIPYEPDYAFEERVLSDPSRAAERRSIAGAFERLADAICALVPDEAEAGARARQYARRGASPPPSGAVAVQFDATRRHAGYDVFLSYASVDADAARELRGRLRAAGLVVFEDRLDAAPGEDWRARTHQALFHSRACLVCCGREGLTRFQAHDLMAAVRGASGGRELTVVPVLLPGAQLDAFRAMAPADLQSRLALDLQDGFDADASVRQLKLFIRSIKAAPAAVHAAAAAEAHPPLAATTAFGAPYPGPRPFGEADVQFFFGREETRSALRDTLLRERIVVLTGPSASGKTSLVEAGLVPLLRDGDVPLAYHRVVPGESPETQLDDAVERLGALTGQRTLLFVDQLERVLRLGSNERVRGVLDRLAAIHAAPGGPALVIAFRDVRLDALTTLAPAGLFGDTRRHQLPRLTDREMRQSIVRPAELAGLAFEPGLVDRLVADWGLDQRFLPFLQHVLHELWVRRREGFLTNDAYDAIPDPFEAVAEAAWATLDPRLKPLAERVIPRIITVCNNLATLDVGCRPGDLVLTGMDHESMRAMLWHLVDHTVLYAYLDANRDVRVAPTFTVEQWERAATWVTEQAPFLEWLSSVQLHRMDWERARRDPNGLLAGRILDEALEKKTTSMADLSTAEVEFITLSAAEQQKQQRTRYAVTAALALIIMLAVGWNWLTQRQQQQTKTAVAAQLDEGDRAAGAGDRSVALAAYTRALELDAADTTARLRRAGVLDAMGQYDAAIADLNEVIARTSGQPGDATAALLVDAHLARGLVYVHRQDPAAALRDFDEAVRLDGANPLAHASRGGVLDQLGQDQEAERAYTRAIELDPDFADALFARGVLYQQLQRPGDAAADFTRVASLPTATSATQQAARSRLEQLEVKVTATAPVQRSRVFLHISSEDDRPAADKLAAALRLRDYDVKGVQLVRTSTRGDVRYYYREDERAAEDVRLTTETAISERGYNVRIEARFLSTKEPVTPGTIEVWLPSLSANTLPGLRYARPTSKKN